MSPTKRRRKDDGGNKTTELLDPTVKPFPLVSSEQPSFAQALASVSKLLESRKNIIVLAGAGISVSCGIPDFRSPQGLYANLDTHELGLSSPEDLFDLEYFQHDPEPFYKFAQALYFPLGKDKRVEPSDSHRFLALLEKQNRLLRVYTQNIDGLEEVAGVSSKRMVYAHGSLQWASCRRCKRRVAAAEIEEFVRNGQVARCRVRKTVPPKRSAARRRTRSEEDSERRCGGVMKPGVTFFGETLHDSVRKSLEADRDRADAVIVIGTSLSVAPMSKVIQYLPPSIPRLLINRNAVKPPSYVEEGDGDDDDGDAEEPEFRDKYTFDAYLLGFCDDVTRSLVKEMKKSKQEQHQEHHHSRQRPPTERIAGGEGGKLLAALEESDDIFSLAGWQSACIPKDRILLFPGALQENSSSKNNNCDDDLTYTEVAHCDGCQEEIVTGNIRKCVECFDYDLCQECYPKLRRKHGGGKHSFAVEKR